MKVLNSLIRKPLFWITAALVIAAAATLAFFVIVPAVSIPFPEEELYANYRFIKQVYMNPLSSFIAFDGYEEYYTLTKDTLTITEASGEQQSFDIGYKLSEVNEQDSKALFMFDTEEGPDISQYKQRYQCTLCDPSEYSPGYTLYLLDGEVWLARVNSGKDGVKYIWSIYSIQTYAGILPWPKETAATASSAPVATEAPAMFDGIYLELYLGGKYIRRINIDGGAQMRIVEGAVMNSMFKEASWPSEDINTLKDYIVISARRADTKKEEEYYVFDRDGKHYIQPGGFSIILDDEPYTSLKELALGYYQPDAMTVVSGENSVYALGYAAGPVVMGAEPQYLEPKQVADHIQYLNIVPGETLCSFTPYINGEKVYGGYKLYDKDFKEIKFIEPSGLEPQMSIFQNAVWPGTYIVELKTEQDGILMQYFFGAILPERPQGQK